MANELHGKHQFWDLSTNSINGSPDNGRDNVSEKPKS
jgi:hypothetical protein